MGAGGLGREYSAGELICREGEPGDNMYVVQEGEVVVSCGSPGAESIVARLGPGAIFGEMAIFTRQPRSATVRALGPARVLTLDRRAFLRRVHEDPSLAFQILQQMAERIRRLNAQLTERRTLETRLAELSQPGTAPTNPLDHADERRAAEERFERVLVEMPA